MGTHVVDDLACLKPGVTVAQAQAEADVVYPQMLAAHPDWTTRRPLTIKITEPSRNTSAASCAAPFLVLWCAVGLILLIACANLSNLLLARAAARSERFAMRSALGAGRSTGPSAAHGEPGARFDGEHPWLGDCIRHRPLPFPPGSIALPLLSTARIDAGALAWTLLIACAATVFFGLVPTSGCSGINLQESLKDGGHGTSFGRKHDRMRGALVVSEVALACVLLVGAGLLLRSFLRVLDVDLGFEPSHAYALKVDFDDGGKAARRGAIFQEMLGRVRALPGIDTAGISDMLPLDRNRSWDLVAKGKPYSKTTNYDAFVYIVSPGYLDAIGMHLRQGRDISWRGHSSPARQSFFINEAAARREWPGQDPIGREALGIGDGVTRVVGVVSDVHESSVEEAATTRKSLYLSPRAIRTAQSSWCARQLPSGALAGSVMSTSTIDESGPTGSRVPAPSSKLSRPCRLAAPLLRVAGGHIRWAGFAAGLARYLWRHFLFGNPANTGDRHSHGSRCDAGARPIGRNRAHPEARARGNRCRSYGILRHRCPDCVAALWHESHRSDNLRGHDPAARRGCVDRRISPPPDAPPASIPSSPSAATEESICPAYLIGIGRAPHVPRILCSSDCATHD